MRGSNFTACDPPLQSKQISISLKGASFVKALVFGSIGTIVETSRLQHDAFHAAFAQHDLDWHWDLPTYQEMLKISGGAKRISAFADKHNSKSSRDCWSSKRSQCAKKEEAEKVA